MNKTILLASASPRRRELLSQIGVEFEVRVSEAEEKTSAKKPEQVVQELAGLKAQAVWETLTEEEKNQFLVIGADTVVVCEDQILGKPKDKEHAFEMLSKLQGRSHQVFTGVWLCRRDEKGADSAKSFYEATTVTMYPMNDAEIWAYIETGEPMDKAGAYGIQGKCAAYVRRIEGDYNNVVGLPVARLFHEWNW